MLMSINPTPRDPGSKIAKSCGLVARASAWLAGASLIVACTLVATPRAWADTITVFNITSTSGAGGIFSGNGYSFGAGSEVTIDTTTGTVTNANILIDNSGGLFASFSSTPNVVNMPAGDTWLNGLTSSFTLTALPNLFTGFTGCQSCTGVFSKGSTVLTGSITLSAVPEPASLVLLGSGLLGLIGLTWRRRELV